MAKVNIANEIKIAQDAVDNIAPGKVIISVEKDADTGTPILCGTYEYSDGTPSVWTERMDRYYTDSDLFVHFFKQRAKWLMASLPEKAAFDGHPATY